MSTPAMPPIVDRATWAAARDELLPREKAHTREGDAIAAARRRLPMTEVPPTATVVGPDGAVPLHEVFEGRSQLVAYFHMWHAGEPFENQCDGCTFFTCHTVMLDYLHARDVTYAVYCQGPYDESKPFADFMGYRLPWYSAAGSDEIVDGRAFGFFACYLRDGDRVFETYWSTDRGVESLMTSYTVLDLTPYGRQESWEDSPPGWPRVPDADGPWCRDGRPIPQWSRLEGVE